MKTVTPMDLRRSLGHILDEASAGERFLIERDHKPLAVLVSIEDANRLEPNDEEVRRQHEAAWHALEDWRRRYRDTRPPDHDEPNAVDWLRADRESHRWSGRRSTPRSSLPGFWMSRDPDESTKR